TLASASPPDVRNGCALPSGCTSDWVAPSLRGQIIRAPGEGIAECDVRRLRQGIAIPHIRAAEPKLTFRKRTNHLCSVTFAKGSKAYRTFGGNFLTLVVSNPSPRLAWHRRSLRVLSCTQLHPSPEDMHVHS